MDMKPPGTVVALDNPLHLLVSVQCQDTLAIALQSGNKLSVMVIHSCCDIWWYSCGGTNFKTGVMECSLHWGFISCNNIAGQWLGSCSCQLNGRDRIS